MWVNPWTCGFLSSSRMPRQKTITDLRWRLVVTSITWTTGGSANGGLSDIGRTFCRLSPSSSCRPAKDEELDSTDNPELHRVVHQGIRHLSLLPLQQALNPLKGDGSNLGHPHCARPLACPPLYASNRIVGFPYNNNIQVGEGILEQPRVSTLIHVGTHLGIETRDDSLMKWRPPT